MIKRVGNWDKEGRNEIIRSGMRVKIKGERGKKRV
jgi:hypothetical protein